jgi:uncharacterized protein YndB with AHSA1/START domain
MTRTGTATAMIEVGCDPHTAYKVFTDDIGVWWKRGTYYWNDSQRGLELRFEPFVGGRLIEVYDLGTGEGLEIGRVQVWEPGHRLVFGWRQAGWTADQNTEVDVVFQPTSAGTRVTIEHRGWDSLGAAGVGMRDGYTQGWAELLGFYAEKVGRN